MIACIDSQSANNDALSKVATICWVAGLEDDNDRTISVHSHSQHLQPLRLKRGYNWQSAAAITPGMFRLRAWSELNRSSRVVVEERKLALNNEICCSIRVRTKNISSTEIRQALCQEGAGAGLLRSCYCDCHADRCVSPGRS